MSNLNGVRFTEDTEAIIEQLDELEKLFAEYLREWTLYKSEAAKSARLINVLSDDMKDTKEYTKNLSELPAISMSLRILNEGMAQHNASLLLQNATLLGPAIKAQAAITYIILVLLLILAVFTTVVLVRDTGFDLEASTGGIKMKSQKSNYSEEAIGK